MELKVLLNDSAETLGVVPEELLEVADELLELDDDDELPHAATSAAIASAGTNTRSQRGIKGTLLS
jgi:broad-specificity NMP kinase